MTRHSRREGPRAPGGGPVGVQRGGARAAAVLLARVGADLGGLQAPHVTPGPGLVQLCGRLLVAERGETGGRENGSNQGTTPPFG